MENIKENPVSVDPINNEDALEIIKDVKKELADYRKPLEKDWKAYDDAYYGKQNKTGEDVKTVKNHIFKIIEGEIPLLTDSLPTTQLTANRDDKQEIADNLGKAIKFVHQDQNLPLLIPSLMRSALTSAPGYLYASWNQDANCGDGKIEYQQLPWQAVFLDGNAQTIEQSEKCRIEVKKRREALIRTWPEFAEEIKNFKSDGLNGESDDSNFEKRDISGAFSVTGKIKPFKAKDILTYAETWIKDYSLQDIPQEKTQEEVAEEYEKLVSGEPAETEKWQNHAEHKNSHKELRGQLLQVVGLPAETPFEEVQKHVEELIAQNPEAEDLRIGLLRLKIIDNHIEEHDILEKLNPTSQEPRFPDGWRVIKSIADKIIVYDGANPEHEGTIPLVPFYGYKDDTIYGFGSVKNIINAQQSLNDVDFREFQGLRVSSNPGWIADFEAEVNEDDLTNEPGIVVQKKRGTEVRRLEPGQVSPQLEQRKQTDQLSMESIEGMNEQSMNGAAPVGNASGVAVQKIQTQPIGRIRLKGRTLEYYSLRRLALITANLIENHWTDEKRLRLRADDNTIEEVIFNPSDLDELEYMIDVSPGSIAGVDKDALIAFYLRLLDSQHITFEMFLSACPEFPGKHVLMKQLKEQNVQGQQVQQAQQQYEGQIQQMQLQMQDVQNQNIKLKGALDSGRQASIELLSPEEKKIFENLNRQEQANNIMPEMASQSGNMEPIMANQNNQGM